MKITHFNDLNMHDSEIKSMTIWPCGDIVLYLTYIEDYDTMMTSLKKLIFRPCFKILMNCNFCTSGNEPILFGKEIEKSGLARGVYAKRKKMTLKTGELKHFYIETSTNAWRIDIIAEGFEWLDWDTQESE